MRFYLALKKVGLPVVLADAKEMLMRYEGRDFVSCTNLASVSGLGNLSGVRSMRFMFASASVATLDFRGFDPSALTDLYYAFELYRFLGHGIESQTV